MGPWHRTIVGVACGMLISAANNHWGDKSTGWLVVIACVLLVGAYAHGWALPRWRQWRTGRREPGYLRIVGGFRSDTRTVIRYANGRQDTLVIPQTAVATASAHDVVATGTRTRRWNRIRRRS
jgi:hypothetical protein